MRERNSIASESANPKITYAIADAPSATSRAGRRPNRSEKRPHIGALTSCATVNADTSIADDGADAEVHRPDGEALAAQPSRVERQKRDDDQQPDHVEERRRHQHHELRRNLPELAAQRVQQPRGEHAESDAHDRGLEAMWTMSRDIQALSISRLLTKRRGLHRTSDDAGQRDDGEHVRNHLDEL